MSGELSEAEYARHIHTLAKALQRDADAVCKPPPEIIPARTSPVIPFVTVKGTRPYIERVVHQVNTTYDDACYDACAVMARRLIETLIIETFEASHLDHKIKKPAGEFMALRDLVEATLNESSWNLGRNARMALKKLKDLGDKSAHDRRYNAVRQYVDELIPHLRSAVHELVSLAGLK